MSGKIRKIVWAFDPYGELEECWHRSVDAIKILMEGGPVSVTPVYVLGSGLVPWVENLESKSLEDLAPKIQETMAAKLKEIKAPKTEAPQILTNHRPSNRNDVQVLADFAKGEKADIILINSHGRQGLPRMFLGSFAEDLLLTTKKNLLFISPRVDGEIKSFQKVLYPTVFSLESYKAFSDFLEENRGVVKEVVIFHKVERPIDAVSQSLSTAFGGGWISPESIANANAEKAMEEGRKWIDLASGSGVKAELVVDDGNKGVTTTITDTALAKKADLIAMNTFAEKIDTITVGSITRNVLRTSLVPVLVRHLPGE